MVATIEKHCKCCKKTITVRLADHKRGWGNFCSKSCKAQDQERRNGQHNGAIMYHAEYVKPYWASSYDRQARIDSHIFYN